jgi:hypothetical protein
LLDTIRLTGRRIALLHSVLLRVLLLCVLLLGALELAQLTPIRPAQPAFGLQLLQTLALPGVGRGARRSGGLRLDVLLVALLSLLNGLLVPLLALLNGLLTPLDAACGAR